MYNTHNPSLISIKSTVGNPCILPPHVNHLDFVLDTNGGVDDYSTLSPLKKLFSQKKDLITIIPARQTLVFRNRFMISGYQVDTTLEMLVAPDQKATRSFIDAFYVKSARDHVSTGLLVATLRAQVEQQLMNNLKIIPLGAWISAKRGEQVKSATRHAALASACKELGLKLFVDTLNIEVTPAYS